MAALPVGLGTRQARPRRAAPHLRLLPPLPPDPAPPAEPVAGTTPRPPAPVVGRPAAPPARPPCRTTSGEAALPRHVVRRRRRRAPGARLLPGLLVAGALAGTWFGASALVAGRAAPSAGAPAPGATLAPGQRYVVQAGDTLWSIAVRLAPAGDPRPLVDELGTQLHGAALQPGEVLVLP